MLRSTVQKKEEKEPGAFRSRVWRRKEYKTQLNKVLMLNSEIANCTFEPEAGSMGKFHEKTLQVNPNLRREGFLEEPDPEAYF
mmetsp:Transcript_39496/g.37964  ORF Transcript_39496/g.37964 Transcript_39496/m.37964 type:complete len:83 (-) Transcript_39496:1896-2144(-)